MFLANFRYIYAAIMKKIAKNDETLQGKNPSNETLPFSVDTTVFTKKPTQKEIEQLRWHPTSGSILDVLKHAASGRAFTCGVFHDNHRKSEKLIKQQIFAVDFDGGMTLKEAEAILKEYNLSYNGGYYSFSHSYKVEKFRLLFVFDGEVHDHIVAKEILSGYSAP